MILNQNQKSFIFCDFKSKSQITHNDLNHDFKSFDFKSSPTLIGESEGVGIFLKNFLFKIADF